MPPAAAGGPGLKAGNLRYNAVHGCGPLAGPAGGVRVMYLYRHISDFKGRDRGLAIAIGNFDGFHKGHQAVVARMQERAAALNLYSAVMIFEPQPLEFFGRAIPARLFTLRDKLRHFRGCGVEIVICVPFTRAFSQLDAREFVQEVLCRRLQVRSITVGSLFTFGRGGVCTIEDLREQAAAAGIEAGAVMAVAADDTRVSSTMLRALVAKGDFDTVRDMTGHGYAIAGRVVHGSELGRTIGFPTANVKLNRRVCPLHGVYAVRVQCGGASYRAVANVGYRPTVASHSPRSLLEVHIVDFDGDIYGREIVVEFVAKLRDERKFSALPELIEQIRRDKASAMAILGGS